MITRIVRVQLIIFMVITVLGVLYLGFGLIGIDALRPPYVVHARFASSGGIFSNAEVTYRGVGIGRVGDLTLQPDGVDVELKIRKGKKVPNDVMAVVANKSAVGEQFVDLQPRRAGGPYLADGDVIDLANTRGPLDVNTLAVDFARLIQSVDKEKLQTLVSELGDAFDGTADSLQSLIDSSDALTTALQERLPDTVQLIREGKIVLDTVRATGGDLQRFAAGLAKLTESIREADPDLRRLLDNGIDAARELDALIRPSQAALSTLLKDLVTVNEIGIARIDGLRQTLNSLPQLVDIGPIAFHDGDPGPGVKGQLHNGLVTEEANPACQYPNPPRQPRDVSPMPPNIEQDCPTGTDPPRGARSVRSSQGGPVTAGSGAPTAPGGEAAGPSPVVRWTGGQQAVLGERSWLSLLLALL